MILILLMLAMIAGVGLATFLLTRYFIRIGDAKQSDRLPTNVPCASCSDDNCICSLGDFDAERKY